MESNKSVAENQPVPIGIHAVNDAALSEHSDSVTPVPVAIYQTEEFLESKCTDSLAEDLALSDHREFHTSELDSDVSTDLSWVNFCKPLLRTGISDHISQTSDLTKEIQSRNFPVTQPLIHESSLEEDAPCKFPLESSQFYPLKADPTGVLCPLN